MKKRIFAVALLLTAGWGLSGMYSVGPAQRGVQVFLGRPSPNPEPPGLHIHAPWPLGSAYLVDVSMVRSIGVKFQWPNEEGRKCYLLTGDENVVELELQVHYVVDDPVTYLYAVEKPARLIAMEARTSSVSLLANMSVDDALTIGRPMLAARLKQRLSAGIAKTLGVKVTSVLITRLTPPIQVKAAFAAVASAKADQAKKINEALGDRNRRVPRARAQAMRRLRVAQAKAMELLSRARGWVSAFNNAFNRYKKAPMVTKTALITERLPGLIKKARLILVDPSKVSDIFLGGTPPQLQGFRQQPTEKTGKTYSNSKR